MENPVDIGLAEDLSFGITVNLTDGAQAAETVRQARTLGYQSIWAGDHIAAHVPINDPLIQLAYLAALAPELALRNVGVPCRPCGRPRSLPSWLRRSIDCWVRDDSFSEWAWVANLFPSTKPAGFRCVNAAAGWT